MNRPLAFEPPYSLVCPSCTHKNSVLSTGCRYCPTSWTRRDAEALARASGVELGKVESDILLGVALGPLARSFGFSGRLGVVSYWLIFALQIAALIGIGFAREADAPLLRVLSFLLYIPLVWSAFAIVVKRLHDFNFSGAWALMLPIPYVGFLMALAVGVVPGTRGANRFGPRGDATLHPAAESVA